MTRGSSGSVRHIGSQRGTTPAANSPVPDVAALRRQIDPSAVDRVVVLADSKPARVANAVTELCPNARVELLVRRPLNAVALRRLRDRVRVHVWATIEDVHMALLQYAPPQLIVDAEGRRRAGVKRFRELFFALSDGGAYIAVAAAGPGGSTGDQDLWLYARYLRTRTSPLRGVWESTENIADLEGVDQIGRRHERELARSLGRVHRSGDFVVLRKVGTHLAKLHEDEVDAIVSARAGPGRLRLRRTLPARVFRSRARVWANSDEPRQRYLSEMSVPALHLREARDVLCAPRQLTVLDNLVLPNSFHHPAIRNLRSRAVFDSSKRYAQLPGAARRASRLDGPFFHLDSEFPGHFGHFFTEDLAKLWPWEEAKRRYPDLRLLVSADGERGPATFRTEALAALGIDAGDVVCIEEPVRIELLLTASQMLHNGSIIYVHPDLGELWRRLRDGLCRGIAAESEKIFVTRPDGKRTCLNRTRLEQTFADHGFDVVRPEWRSLADQADLFASATVIAGLAGSGMFNSIYASGPGTRIVIASETYKASNEYLISSVIGGDFYHFACPIGPYNTVSPRPNGTFHRDFAFDFDRDGPALKRLLTSL